MADDTQVPCDECGRLMDDPANHDCREFEVPARPVLYLGAAADAIANGVKSDVAANLPHKGPQKIELAGWATGYTFQMPDRLSGWPCANYRDPATCLTAPSTATGRCDWCADIAWYVIDEATDALDEYSEESTQESAWLRARARRAAFACDDQKDGA